MEWRPIPGHQNVYEVSEAGHVRNIRTGHTLTPVIHPGGYWTYSLGYVDRRRHSFAHRLVAAAFIGDPGNSDLVRHLDDNPNNNHWTNLAYGTHSDNLHDAVRNGHHRNQNTRKTHCQEGHEFTPENTAYGTKGDRRCRQCVRVYTRLAARRRRARLRDQAA
jgi:hypothetical protein